MSDIQKHKCENSKYSDKEKKINNNTHISMIGNNYYYLLSVITLNNKKIIKSSSGQQNKHIDYGLLEITNWSRKIWVF